MASPGNSMIFAIFPVNSGSIPSWNIFIKLHCIKGLPIPHFLIIAMHNRMLIYYATEYIEMSSCFNDRHCSSARKNCNLRSLGLT